MQARLKDAGQEGSSHQGDTSEESDLMEIVQARANGAVHSQESSWNGTADLQVLPDQEEAKAAAQANQDQSQSDLQNTLTDREKRRRLLVLRYASESADFPSPQDEDLGDVPSTQLRRGQPPISDLQLPGAYAGAVGVPLRRLGSTQFALTPMVTEGIQACL